MTLSSLGHTWILDLDGTLVVHNGHKRPEGDSWLPGALEFLQSIPNEDMIVIITSRSEEYRSATEAFLVKHAIRFDHILFSAPYGERIVLNDGKPSGLTTAYALNLERDKGLPAEGLFSIDPEA